jgi:hypothetical protein
MHSVCQDGCHGKADGKKKVMGKERRSKKWTFVEKEGTYNIYKLRQLPINGKMVKSWVWCDEGIRKTKEPVDGVKSATWMEVYLDKNDSKTKNKPLL